MSIASNNFTYVWYMMAAVGIAALIAFSSFLMLITNTRAIAQMGLDIMAYGGWYVNLGFNYKEQYWKIDNNQIHIYSDNQTIIQNETTKNR
jgi:hypothetical protein